LGSVLDYCVWQRGGGGSGMERGEEGGERLKRGMLGEGENRLN
jgi:hypothetical protein